MLLLAEMAFCRTLNLIRIIPAEGVSKSVNWHCFHGRCGRFPCCSDFYFLRSENKKWKTEAKKHQDLFSARL